MNTRVLVMDHSGDGPMIEAQDCSVTDLGSNGWLSPAGLNICGAVSFLEFQKCIQIPALHKGRAPPPPPPPPADRLDYDSSFVRVVAVLGFECWVL